MKHRKTGPVDARKSEFDRRLLAGLDAHAADGRKKTMEIAAMISMSDIETGGVVGKDRCGPAVSNEGRLAYYRSHGLDRCDDYPGGDAQFEADVLSGLYHDDGPDGLPKKEDAYIIKKLEDGVFQVDLRFNIYVEGFALDRAYVAACTRRGWVFNSGRGHKS